MFESDLIKLHNVSGPTRSERFTRSYGRCRRQSKQLDLSSSSPLYILVILNTETWSITYSSISMLCLFVGPDWFQRQAWHRRHHRKDSESLLVCDTLQN